MDRKMFHDEIVNSGCTPTCDCVKEPPKEPLSELLRKLDDLSKENFELVNSIKDNLYGDAPDTQKEGCAPIGCIEDCIKNILTNVNLTNAVLIQIRERL